MRTIGMNASASIPSNGRDGTRRQQRRRQKQHGGGLYDIIERINTIITQFYRTVFNSGPPADALVNVREEAPPEIIEQIDEQLAHMQKIQRRRQIAKAFVTEAGRRRVAAREAAVQAELQRRLEEEQRLAEAAATAARRLADAEETNRMRAAAAEAAKAAAAARAAAAERKEAEKAAKEEEARISRALREHEQALKSTKKAGAAKAKTQATEQERQALLDELERDRQAEAAREARRIAAAAAAVKARDEARAAAAAAAAAAVKAQEDAARRQEALKASQDTIIEIIEKAALLYEERAKAAAAAAEQAAKEAAAAAAEAALRELRQQVVAAAAVAGEAAAAKREAAYKPIKNYESAIDKKKDILLRNKSVQQAIFIILSNLNRILYESQGGRADLVRGLSPDVAAKFTTPASIKKHVFRFFVKGGSAAAFLFNLKDTNNVYKFTNDIDTIILINPALPSRDYNQLHANLIKVIIKSFEQILVTSIPLALQAAVREFIGEVHNQQPHILKYIGSQQGMVIPQDVEHGQLAAEVNAIADELSAGPFPIVAYIERNASQLVAERTPIVDILQANDNTINALRRTNGRHMGQIKRIEQQKQRLHPQQQIDFMTYMQQQSGLQTEIGQINARIADLEAKNAVTQERLNEVDKRITSNDTDLAKGKSALANRLFTYTLHCNHGYTIPTGSPDPPEPFIKIHNGNRYKYINETLIDIKPFSRPFGRIDMLDIVIPFKNNTFLEDDWKYWSAKNIEIAGAGGLHFDVADESYTLFDQNRATRGSEGIPHLADKYASRRARMEYLQAQVARLLERRNNFTRKAVRRFRKLMPAANFARIFPEGAAASASASASGSGSATNSA